MVLYRLARLAHARKLDGLGAKHYPGRWNSLGVPMIYCAGTIAQCLVEVLVHLDEAPEDYYSVQLEVPDDVNMAQLVPKQLPKQWKDAVYNTQTRAVGDAFIQSDTMLMRVPSAVVDGEFNFLLNPAHPDIARVKVGLVKPFHFDERLFRRP